MHEGWGVGVHEGWGVDGVGGWGARDGAKAVCKLFASHGHGHLDARDEGAGQDAGEGAGAEEAVLVVRFGG